VFASGRSQAVRIPKGYRFVCDEVYVEKRGDRLILTPKPKSWDGYFERGRRFGSDFPDHIEDALPEEREALE
jgi:antitoxin VapB